MATTGELRVIIEELELVDVGDAASYLGEESPESFLQSFDQFTSLSVNAAENLVINDCTSC